MKNELKIVDVNKEVEKIQDKLCKKYPEFINKKDLFDFQAEYDPNISFNENFKEIEKQLLMIGLIKHTPTNEELKQYEEEQKKFQQMLLEEEKRNLDEMMNERYEQIIKRNTPEIDKFFRNIRDNINMVCDYNEHHCLLLLGKAGLGKTYNTVMTLKKKGKNFYLQTGNISPLSMFHLLYTFRKENDVLIFDDTQSLLKNRDSLSVLNSAIWSPTGIRICMWKTTKKLMCPNIFEFKGKIIFIANNLPKNEPIFSRALIYTHNLNYHEILEVMYEKAKTKHEILTKEERIDIVNWIRENTDETTLDMDLRLQNKIELAYIYSKDNGLNWKEIAKTFIKGDEIKRIVKEICEQFTTVKEQNKKWIEETGLSPRTLQRIKADMGLTKRR